MEKTSLPNLENGNKIIYGCVVGSHAYGTNVEGSDIDRKWIYVQSADDLFINGYKGQINISKDEVIIELSRFIELLRKANPTMLELLYTPKDCIIYVHPAFTLLLNVRREFLTKQCYYSFAGYAEDQIEKAYSLDKKINWDKENTDRKSVLDFCYFITNKTDPNLRHARFQSDNILKSFARSEIGRMGLSAIPHTRGLYNLYWDAGVDFGGICSDEYKANDISVSVIPENSNCIGVLYFNKDEYSTHCKRFKEYEQWLKERNTQRFVDVENHQQKIDGKNLLHCVRLIETACDIVTRRELIIRRLNADYLKQIRRGVYNLDNILQSAKRELVKLKSAFEECSLPDKFQGDFIVKLIQTDIRKQLFAESKKQLTTY